MYLDEDSRKLFISWVGGWGSHLLERYTYKTILIFYYFHNNLNTYCTTTRLFMKCIHLRDRSSVYEPIIRLAA